jgi:hypothetical protein
MLYLYAVVDVGARARGRAGPGGSSPDRPGVGHGLQGEPLALVDEGGVLAVAGAIGRPPAVSAEALRAHDEVVRRLARMSRAILPVRFGTVLDDEPALRRALGQRSAALREALRAVAGCAQMTLRIFGPASRPGVIERPGRGGPGAGRPPGPSASPTGESGTAFLLARAQARRREEALDVVARLRARLEPFVQGERIERHARPPLVASVHHLVPTRQVAAYHMAVQAAADDLRPWRLAASGPWAPYAFAPEAVA